MSRRVLSSENEGQLFIGGSWQESTDGEQFEAINPATGDLIAQIASGTREDAQRAIDVANKAPSEWAGKPP